MESLFYYIGLNLESHDIHPTPYVDTLPSIRQQVYFTVRVPKLSLLGHRQVDCIDESNYQFKGSLVIPEFHLKKTPVK